MLLQNPFSVALMPSKYLYIYLDAILDVYRTKSYINYLVKFIFYTLSQEKLFFTSC